MSETAASASWNEYQLSDLANYFNGYAFRPEDWAEDGLPIIRIEQLNNPDGPYDYFRGLVLDVNRITDGDLIFSWSATLKVVIWKHGESVLNQHLFKVVEKEGFHKHFVFHVLDFNMDALAAGSHGSTMKHIKRGELDSYTIKAPSLAGQRRIAEILSTVDEAIEQTEALIAKTRQIKAGLMHDLFTRGVTPDGQLRPTREEAPQLYKESPLGWVPKEWELLAVEDLLDRIIDYRGKTPTKTASGIPLITAKNVRVGYVDPEPREFIAASDYKLWMTRGIPEPSDILFTTEAPLGNVAQVITADKVAFAQRVIILRPSANVSSGFLKYRLMCSDFQNGAMRRASPDIASKHLTTST